MKTLYSACLSRIGLTQAGAATLHGVRPDTVKNWAVGRRGVPQSAWDDLRAYSAQIEDAADAMLEAWDNAGSPPIEIDDSEADGPALMTAAALVLATDGPVHVGQTDATRMARQARRAS